MAFAKTFLALSPLLSLALAVALSFWAMTVPPAQAYNRAPRFGPNQDNPTNVMVDPAARYGCGYYNTSDPQDAGIAHQPCYAWDGSIQFCCLSGSSKCACPLGSGAELGCYNYEAGNSLNANTGEECGHFLPDLVGAESARRQLAGCTCPSEDACGEPFIAEDLDFVSLLGCLFAPSTQCFYDGFSGNLVFGNNDCCTQTSNCTSG